MRRTSILDGMNVADLQAQLAAIQAAYLQLQSGAKVAVAGYAQGDGSRSVSYTQADQAAMVQTILLLQTQIDIATGAPRVNRRAPMRPVFGSHR